MHAVENLSRSKTFANCSRTMNVCELFTNARDTFTKFCKVFLQSTVRSFQAEHIHINMVYEILHDESSTIKE